MDLGEADAEAGGDDDQPTRAPFVEPGLVVDPGAVGVGCHHPPWFGDYLSFATTSSPNQARLSRNCALVLPGRITVTQVTPASASSCTLSK